MLKIQVQGHDFIVDVVHVDSNEDPEGQNTMCLAKVGALTFQYQMPADEAHPYFRADLEQALRKGEVRQGVQPVVFLVVRYRTHFVVDWAFHEWRLNESLLAARLGAMDIADAAISNAAWNSESLLAARSGSAEIANAALSRAASKPTSPSSDV